VIIDIDATVVTVRSGKGTGCRDRTVPARPPPRTADGQVVHLLQVGHDVVRAGINGAPRRARSVPHAALAANIGVHVGGGPTPYPHVAPYAATPILISRRRTAVCPLTFRNAGCYHAGDSDGTASICGNLLGAALGAGAIDAELFADLEGPDVIEQVSDDLHDLFITRTISGDRY
jgi:hypothetical protein